MNHPQSERIATANVRGQAITLGRDEMLEIHQQAWWCHRARPGHRRLVDLPATLMARILGRKACHDGRYIYTADADTGTITCGCQVIWKSGGRQVLGWVLAHTSEEDLALADYVDRLMWLSNCCNLAATGHPICPEHAPTAWCNGQEITEEEYREMLGRLDRAGGEALSRLERQLARLLGGQE